MSLCSIVGDLERRKKVSFSGMMGSELEYVGLKRVNAGAKKDEARCSPTVGQLEDLFCPTMLCITLSTDDLPGANCWIAVHRLQELIKRNKPLSIEDRHTVL